MLLQWKKAIYLFRKIVESEILFWRKLCQSNEIEMDFM